MGVGSGEEAPQTDTWAARQGLVIIYQSTVHPLTSRLLWARRSLGVVRDTMVKRKLCHSGG